MNNWEINYLKVGKGPHNLLCLPGALGTIWTDFKPQIEGINRDKFTLIVWDPPGFGKSRPPEKDFLPDFYEKDADYAYEFMKVIYLLFYQLQHIHLNKEVLNLSIFYYYLSPLITKTLENQGKSQCNQMYMRLEIEWLRDINVLASLKTSNEVTGTPMP